MGRCTWLKIPKGSDGKASDYLQTNGILQAWYDSFGDSKAFATTNTTVETVGDAASTITLAKGQKVYLEVLSPEVARTVDGSYYVKVGAEGADAYEKAEKGEVSTGSEELEIDKGIVILTTTESFDVVYDGTTYLNIKNYYADDDLVFIEYMLFEDGNPVALADSDGDVFALVVGEDGTVAPVEESAWTAVEQTGSVYPVSGVSAAKTVALTLEDGALVDADPDDALAKIAEPLEAAREEAARLAEQLPGTTSGIAAGEGISLVAPSIGTDDNAYDMAVEGPLNISTPDGEPFGTVNIANNGDLTINAISATGNVTLVSSGNLQVEGDGASADVNIKADGDIGTSDEPFVVKTKGGKVSYNSEFGGKPNVKVTDTSVKPTPTPNPTPTPTPTPAKVVSADKKIVAKATPLAGKKVRIKWNKIKGAGRYVIYLAKSKNNKKKFKKFKKVKVVKGSKKSGVVKKLKAHTLYKFKVVAQKKVNGKWKKMTTSPKSYFVSKKAKKAKKGSGSSEKKVKFTVKKKSFTLAVGKTAKIKAKLKFLKKSKKKGLLPTPKKIRYLSADPSIAKVSKKGKITAKKAGKCNIYVYRINGSWKKVKVTVK